MIDEAVREVEPLLGTAPACRAHDATAAQVALAWAIRHPNVVAIPGASSVAQLEANVGAVDLGLTDTDLAGLTAGADAYANGR